jgi:uncharacterized protein (TIGR02596 family)
MLGRRFYMRRVAGATSGFSLIELLVVMAIIVILIAFVTPAFNSMGKASSLTNGASMIVDQLNLARQTALTQNRMVQVRFYKLQDELQSPAAYRAIQLMIFDESGLSSKPLTKVQQLPNRVVVMEDGTYSTILDATKNKRPESRDIIPNAKQEVPYHFFRYRPGGATDLDPNGAPGGDRWFLTVKSENDKPAEGKPAANYVTAVVDPVSGRVKTLRP